MWNGGGEMVEGVGHTCLEVMLAELHIFILSNVVAPLCCGAIASVATTSGRNSHAILRAIVCRLVRKAADAVSASRRRSRRWRKYCRSIWLRPAVETWHNLRASLRLAAANARSTNSEDATLDSSATTNAPCADWDIMC